MKSRELDNDATTTARDGDGAHDDGVNRGGQPQHMLEKMCTVRCVNSFKPY